METIRLFLLIDLEAAIVVIEIVFIRPVEPDTVRDVARNAKSSADVALPLERSTVIQYGAIKRWDGVQPLTNQHLIDESVAVAEQERRNLPRIHARSNSGEVGADGRCGSDPATGIVLEKSAAVDLDLPFVLAGRRLGLRAQELCRQQAAQKHPEFYDVPEQNTPRFRESVTIKS